MRLFPLQIIYRDDGAPYLKRWTLFNFFGLFKLRLHHILLSDYDCVHDHPWWFITYLLKGSYWEKEPKDQWSLSHLPKMGTCVIEDDVVYTLRKQGSLLFRPAKFRHSLKLQPFSLDKNGNAVDYHHVWTLVLMGPRVRLWGFWTKMGFIPHFNYNSKQKCD